MKALAWYSLIFSSFCTLYLLGDLIDGYGTASENIFAITMFTLNGLLPALYIFGKKK